MAQDTAALLGMLSIIAVAFEAPGTAVALVAVALTILGRFA